MSADVHFLRGSHVTVDNQEIAYIRMQEQFVEIGHVEVGADRGEQAIERTLAEELARVR